MKLHVYTISVTMLQVSTVDGRTLQSTEIGSMLNTAAPTPEPFGSMADDGFYSKYIVYRFLD